jgi:hypothetical protein
MEMPGMSETVFSEGRHDFREQPDRALEVGAHFVGFDQSEAREQFGAGENDWRFSENRVAHDLPHSSGNEGSVVSRS